MKKQSIMQLFATVKSKSLEIWDKMFRRAKTVKHGDYNEITAKTVNVGQRHYNNLEVRKISGTDGLEERLIMPTGLMVRREYC